MQNKNSGYHGWSMSNRACQAYEEGKMPMSKWSRYAIVDQMERDGWDDAIIERAKKTSVKALRDACLRDCGYHHTGKYCRRTSFYGLIDVEDFDEDVKRLLAILEDNLAYAKARTNENDEIARAKYIKDVTKLIADVKKLGGLDK